MDFAELKLSLEAARKFEVALEGATFEMRLPHEHAWRVSLETGTSERGKLLHSKVSRAVVEPAMVGWRGVTARHFDPDQPPEPIDYSPQARNELLDCRQDLTDQLAEALAGKRNERKKKMEEGRKNS